MRFGSMLSKKPGFRFGCRALYVLLPPRVFRVLASEALRKMVESYRTVRFSCFALILHRGWQILPPPIAALLVGAILQFPSGLTGFLPSCKRSPSSEDERPLFLVSPSFYLRSRRQRPGGRQLPQWRRRRLQIRLVGQHSSADPAPKLFSWPRWKWLRRFEHLVIRTT